MSDVPNDLFREVLRRVPVESLFRLRSVCKAWCHIIDDPSFAKLHINRGMGGNWLIIRNDTGKVFLLSMRHMIYRKRCIEWVEATNIKTMVGRGVPRVRYLPVPSCNGLILVSTCKKNLVWLIWNPFTGEYLELPQCDQFPNFKCGNFDSPHSGLGYDEANDDYKAVRIVENYTFIYSLSLKEWRRIENFPNCTIESENGAFVNGALHWVAYSKEHGEDDKDDKNEDENDDENVGLSGWIVALDLSTETYCKIPLPSKITESNKFCLDIHALGGSLLLSCCNLRERYVVWMLKNYGCENIWVEVISLKQNDYGYSLRPIAYSYSKSKKQALLHCEKDEFLWYDVKTKCSKKVSLDVNPDANDKTYEYIYDTFSYQVSPASLVRLNRRDGAYEGGVASEGTSKRKRKRAPDSLGLKTIFGSPESW